MFIPARLKFVQIVSDTVHREEVLTTLYRTGFFHFIEGNKVINSFKSIYPQKELDQLYEIRDMLIRNGREFIEDKDIVGNIRSVKELSETKDILFYEGIEKLNSLSKRIDKLQHELSILEFIRTELILMTQLGTNANELISLKDFFCTIGVIDKRNINKLLSQISPEVIIFYEEIFHDQITIIIISPRNLHPQLSQLLEDINFHHFHTPEEYREDPNKGLIEIEKKIKIIEKEVENQKDIYKNRLKEVKEKIQILYADTKKTIEFYEYLKKSFATDSITIIMGFIPSNKLHEFHRLLDNSSTIIVSEEPTKIEKKVPIPSLLNNPAWLKPFEDIVRSFGLPSYNSIDPTIIVSFTFSLIFGIMFADIIHGLLIFLTGIFFYWLYKRVNQKILSSLSGYLIICGISSSLWGWMFGSVMGEEGIVPPLWFSPSEHILKILSFSLVIGISIIVLSMIFNISQFLLTKKYLEVWISSGGVFTLTFYLTFLGVMFLCIKYNYFSFTTGFILVILPLLFSLGIHTYITKGKDFIGNIFEVIEEVISLLSNTVSFMRIGAFNLNHSALCMALIVFSNIFSHGIAFLKWPIFIMEHILLIVVEGLIVSIQCMRLHYYEFFCRFFKGEGVPFTPLKVENE